MNVITLKVNVIIIRLELGKRLCLRLCSTVVGLYHRINFCACRLRCERTTAFWAPVVPLEKRIRKGSSADRWSWSKEGRIGRSPSSTNIESRLTPPSSLPSRKIFGCVYEHAQKLSNAMTGGQYLKYSEMPTAHSPSNCPAVLELVRF